jgi:two-component system, cell cycle sensor histidine kinase and response regulator CckA
MNEPVIRVLLVEDSPADALIVREELADATGASFALTHVEEMSAALRSLRGSPFDVVLLDLGLPDADGLDAFTGLHAAVPDVPVIILSGRNDEKMAMHAVHAGAEDYLVKGQGNAVGLVRSIQYAIERTRAKETMAAHARQQQAVAALGQHALAGVDIDLVLAEATEIVAQTLSTELCKIVQLLPGGESLFLRSGIGWNEGLVGRTTVDVDLGSQAGFALRMKQPVLVEDLAEESRFKPSSLVRDHGVVSGVSVVIQGRRAPWGVLGVHSRKRRAFAAHEVTFLQTVAHVLGEAIERKVTEAALHESDARFHQVVENIHEALWILEVETKRVVYVSPRFADIWGCSETVLLGSPNAWLDSVHPEDRDRIRGLTAKGTMGGKGETYRIVRPDKAVRWIRHRTFAARDGAGRVRRIIAVAEDTTEQRKLEEQFLRSQRMEAIGTLASGVAHDLNNILAPVLMTAELLTARAQGGRDRELLSMMAQGAQRAAQTVKQLLLFSRGMEGQRGLVQVRHLLKEMGGIMRETFPREITIVENPEPDIWPVVADATQLHQVLMNLCVNARDAMPNGGTLTVGARNLHLGPDEVHIHPDALPARYLVIAVTDTGHGIPPDILNRIFDPFFTTKELGKGSGLGLSTVVGIMRSHGGFMTVYSEPGHGSVFRAYLPAAGEAALSALLQPGTPSPLGRGELVLVVDDELAIREATREILELNQYRVLTAADGREAMNVFLKERENVRLVLTDVMMPVMSGIALVRALRGLEPGVKVIAASGLDHDGKRNELAALGVSEVLMKPYAPTQLLAAMRRQLSTGRSAVPWV